MTHSKLEIQTSMNIIFFTSTFLPTVTSLNFLKVLQSNITIFLDTAKNTIT